MKIFDDIQNALLRELPFVVYKTPNSDYIKAFFQRDSNLYNPSDYLESGFVFAPFDNQQEAILIPNEKSIFEKEKINFNVDFPQKNKYAPDDSQKKHHVNLVEKGIQKIVNANFKKVVLSRRESLELKSDFNDQLTLKRLIKKYPTAFVYLWYHPKVGKWMGATPETLLEVKNKEFKTMSLAGTQLYNEEKKANWSPKEIEEQYIVTDYIKSKLSVVVNNLFVNEIETIKIGNLLHLRTLISGKVDGNISKLIEVLHPTPAVCGFPKNQTKDFILHQEGYNRKFYTGFLGELNLENNEKSSLSNLYVNLRCMEITSESSVKIYIGGGVTKDSDSEKEWEETVAKSLAMKNVL